MSKIFALTVMLLCCPVTCFLFVVSSSCWYFLLITTNTAAINAALLTLSLSRPPAQNDRTPVVSHRNTTTYARYQSVYFAHSISLNVLVHRFQERRLSELFCAVLCTEVVHSRKHTLVSSSYSSLDWVLSHWAHFTVHSSFVFMYVYFVFVPNP